MIVNPQQSLTGELRSTGDLISVNQPLNCWGRTILYWTTYFWL